MEKDLNNNIANQTQRVDMLLRQCTGITKMSLLIICSNGIIDRMNDTISIGH